MASKGLMTEGVASHTCVTSVHALSSYSVDGKCGAVWTGHVRLAVYPHTHLASAVVSDHWQSGCAVQPYKLLIDRSVPQVSMCKGTYLHNGQ